MPRAAARILFITAMTAALMSACGREDAATVAERGLLSLHAPIARVTAPDTVVALPRLENAYMPSEKQIVEAARRVVSFS